jgi:hypothetical protein
MRPDGLKLVLRAQITVERSSGIPRKIETQYTGSAFEDTSMYDCIYVSNDIPISSRLFFVLDNRSLST